MAEGQMSGGQPLPSDPTKPVNPFQPKPQGPVLPDRQMAAYGGIMGLDGRKQYGIGSWFQENIMDPIKKNPAIAAAAAAIGGDYIMNDRSYISDFLGNDTIQNILKGKKVAKRDEAGNVISEDGEIVYTDERKGGVYDALAKNIVPIIGGIGAGIFTKNEQGAGGGQDASTYGQVNDQTAMNIKEYTKGLNLLDEKGMMAAGQNFAVSDNARKYSPTEMLEVYQNAANGGRIGYAEGKKVDYEEDPLYINQDYDEMTVPLTEYEKALREMTKRERQEEFEMLKKVLKQRGNIGRDLGIAGGGQTGMERQMELLNFGTNTPDKDTGYKDNYSMKQRAAEYLDRPYFNEQYETGEHYANGGRIGFNMGGGFSPNDLLLLKKFKMNPKEVATYKDGGAELLKSLRSTYIPKAEGGIMDLGGMEKDYRAEGGFVPIGREEKADDVPARLSVNEFVFTADAVRNAGGGDIDQGAQVMENMMKHLEAGGQVSEESQGMAGAREMFETSERLSEVV